MFCTNSFHWVDYLSFFMRLIELDDPLQLRSLDLVGWSWRASPLAGLSHQIKVFFFFSKMDTFVQQALVAAEIRDRAKAFEPQSFHDKFNWPFIFHFEMKASHFVAFITDTCAPSLYLCLWALCGGGRLKRRSDVAGCLGFSFFYICIPLLFPIHLHGNTSPASCCCLVLPSCWILIITFKGKRHLSSFIKCLIKAGRRQAAVRHPLRPSSS